MAEKTHFSNLKKIFLLFLSSVFLTLPFAAFALVFQVNYPALDLPDIGRIVITPASTLNDVVRYIYFLFIVIGGIVALAGMVYGGFLWLTSGGSPGKVSEARTQVISAFAGLVLILSSWVILFRMDPSLVRFQAFAPALDIPPPMDVPATPIHEGFILWTKPYDELGEICHIDVPGGKIQVEDTSRFPVSGTTVDLGGPTNTGDNNCLQSIEFYNPLNPAGPCNRDSNNEIIWGPECGFSHYYTVICFSEPNFRGSAAVISSFEGNDSGETECDANSHPGRPLTNTNLFPGLPPDTCCRSLYAVKQPAASVYSLGDQIFFYETPFPINLNPADGSVEGGACIKIDSAEAPENCHETITETLNSDDLRNNYIDFMRRSNGALGRNTLDELRSGTEDENGNLLYEWGGVNDIDIRPEDHPGPLSMDIRADRLKKYLILLFQEIDFGGNAYLLFEDVPTFRDPQDERLYWTRTGGHSWPRSALILPIEPTE